MMKRSDENRLEAFEMKALKTDFVSVMDGKEYKFVGLGTGRCQQNFTSKCKKWEVEILQSHHERRRQIS